MHALDSRHARLGRSACAFVAVAAVALVLAGCGGGDDPPAGVARLDESSCPYTLHPSQTRGTTVRCGELVVAQDRRDSQSPAVRVPYAVFIGNSSTRRAPVVYLAGGPGETWLAEVPRVAAGFSPGFGGGAKLQRDEIVIEQRGSRATRPGLRCDTPEWYPEAYQNPEAQLPAQQTSTAACGAAALLSGTRTEGFNTDELAADVDDLRRLLGYDQVVLNGVSYGTEWAMAVMSRFPATVELALLDSLVQQSVRPLASLAAGFEPALQALSDLCDGDPECAVAGTPLIQRVEAVVGALQSRPPAWQRGPGGRLTSGAFLTALTGALAFDARSAAQLVGLAESLVATGMPVDTLANEVQDQLRALAVNGAQTSYDGQFLSISCADNATVTRAQIDASLLGVRPAFRGYAQGVTGALFQLCQIWPARRDLPAEAFTPLRSNIRTLVLSGAFDPLTPRARAEEAVRTLPASTLVRFPLRGHALQGSPCANALARAFFDNAALDTACASTDGL